MGELGQHTEHEMICTCQIDEFEIAEHAKLAALIALGGKRKEDLATAVLLSLGLEHGVQLDVASDMWFGVCGTLLDGTVHSVECDDPLDGMVFIWNILERERATRSAASLDEQRIGDGAHNSAIALALESAGMLAELRSIADARDGHNKACPTCVDGKTCSDGYKLRERSIELRGCIVGSWGSPDVRNAPGFYGLTAEDVADGT